MLEDGKCSAVLGKQHIRGGFLIIDSGFIVKLWQDYGVNMLGVLACQRIYLNRVRSKTEKMIFRCLGVIALNNTVDLVVGYLVVGVIAVWGCGGVIAAYTFAKNIVK